MTVSPQNHQDTKSHKNVFTAIPSELEETGKKIVHAAYLVHAALGPGLLIAKKGNPSSIRTKRGDYYYKGSLTQGYSKEKV